MKNLKQLSAVPLEEPNKTPPPSLVVVAETGRRITARYLDRFFGRSGLSKTSSGESIAIPEEFLQHHGAESPHPGER